MASVGPVVNFRALVLAWAEARSAFRSWFSVIVALMLRETRTRHGDSALGYGWALIDPLIELVVMWGIFLLIGRTLPIAVPVPVFLITGIFPFSLWRDAVSRGATAARSNAPLLIYPQVSLADCIIARILLETATTIIVMHLFIIGLVILYGQSIGGFYDEPLQIMAAWGALLLMSAGSGFLSAGLARLFPPWPTLFSYCSRPLFLTSGIFFTLGSLPSNARAYAIDNPLAHMLEWIRSASLPGFESDIYSVRFVLTTALVVLFVGLLLDRILHLTGHVEPKG